MSRRNSEYALQPNELYCTPPWVTRAVAPYIPKRIRKVWEPACGLKHMSDELKRLGFHVIATDVASGHNFLSSKPMTSFNGIVTNPPFKQAQQFIERALYLTKQRGGVVAMLLPSDYDFAKTRRHLFVDHPAYSKRAALNKRIKWFAGSKGPSEYHAWFIWDWKHQGPSVNVYPICEDDDYQPPVQGRIASKHFLLG